ncbi:MULTISPECIES: 2-oxoglutarate dehydrogenase complex dihydrolipoyllysine-residue succinyltransferase [unclassified Bacillus (in: firmicutes)]|uniref:2-oxoglutarate dehydrogenase complex dihydrolipoyllysine-residue succinyltransferase n=1 Tax=unclassified Bacillus (in: firmicutes) TaxID=185979 RepID=UPI0008E3AE2E|nr:MULTISPECIES: 2-oxoglutarate dehydrogenase complex dihydrolipoyllysine-residue succinyltransferase [unclassified Bacillus (in: firmicutes)]SFA91557.1 2-oxoglutarate dehydrogenase E2 component [Bacillus sp. UNCCL13]SFQ85597.1 2-oxoglutarate dehydrogenase E2 component [Bacillus sp. cl95]
MAEIKVPELAESITEGTIARWLKNKGDRVEKGDYIVELETDKVNVEIISEQAGILTELNFEEGDTVKVGETIALVSEGGEEAEPVSLPSKEENEEDIKKESSKESKSEEVVSNDLFMEKTKQRPIASPAARKLAREKGIDLNDVQTKDPLGRVRLQDITSLEIQKVTPQPEKQVSEQVGLSINTSESVKPIEREKMSRRRQTIAKRLVEVQQTAAMLTTFNEVDMSEIMKLRNKRKDKFYAEHDVRLGFMSFFTKAVVAALKKYPYLNAEIQGDELLVKKFYDIGIAVAAPDGLVVPVVRDADRKSFAEIETSILDLANKAKVNKLSISDLQGGTFTITNGGVFGSLLSTPILNGPQVGILGMHKIQLRPIAIDEERMENRPMMFLALSYDHRIVDGKEAVSFLVKIKELLEDPDSLLLES